MRITLDREHPLYKAMYTQRTSCERINSQAKELGIERPRIRNGRSVANLNTLISDWERKHNPARTPLPFLRHTNAPGSSNSLQRGFMRP